MTPAERTELGSAIAGCDAAMTWLEADLRRLERSLEEGMSLETLGAIHTAILKAKARMEVES